MVDGNSEECAHLSPEEAWDEFDLLVQCWVLYPRRSDVNEAMYALEKAIKEGQRPTAEDVQEARRTLDSARELVEKTYASLADGVEPWDDGAGSTTPHGVFADHLEEHGYTVYRPGEEPVELSQVHGEHDDRE